MRIYRLIGLYLAIIAIIGCTPQRRLTRLCKNYPLLCETESRTVDTIFKVQFLPKLDTVRVVDRLIDTLEVHDNGDTFIITLNQDTLFFRDTLRFERMSAPDTTTIYKERVVVKYKTKGVRWYLILSTAVILILGVWLITKRQ